MRLAIEEALLSREEVPVGALIVDANGAVIARGRNRKELEFDPTSHAEIEAIRSACKQLEDWRLTGHTILVTLEPCVMCAGAIVAARLQTVIFGTWDINQGACGSVYDVPRDSRLGPPVEVIGGVLAVENGELLSSFFKSKRQTRHKE